MKELYCNYCHGAIENKKKDSRRADGKRYHIECLRILRKKIDKQKGLGKIKPGQENEIDLGKLKDEWNDYQ